MLANFQPFPHLSTPRIVLREIRLSDDKEVFFERSDAEMNKYIDRAPAKTIEDAHAWINMITGLLADNKSIAWAATLKDSDTLMGGFCLWNFSHERNTAEIGFSLHPQHWGKGYMREIIEAGMQYGFDVMKLDAITACTHPGNRPSLRVLGRAGFKADPDAELQEGEPYEAFILTKEDYYRARS